MFQTFRTLVLTEMLRYPLETYSPHLYQHWCESDLHTSALNSMGSPLAIQPPLLMNRFMINLRSINTAGSSQGSSARQHWSRFSAPNFHIPDSFLGNIGEDLQDGHEPANADLESHNEMDVVRLNTEGPPGTELEEEIFTTPGSSNPRPMVAPVSLQI